MELTKYCDFFNLKNKIYLLNTNNGCLIQLDKQNYNKLCLFKTNKDVSIFSPDEADVLLDQEFIVDSNFDSNIKAQNTLTYNSSKYSTEKETIKIDFAITGLCNFCCPYCFEKNNLNKTTNSELELLETADKLYRYIDMITLDYVKDLKIVYYGGEPTIEKKFIIQYNNRIKNLLTLKKIKYHFNIITNGFLLDEDFIKSINADDCDFIQITIDGEKNFHNQRRTTQCKINTFDKIINNIKSCALYKIKVVIRLNVDKSNFSSIKKFIISLPNLLNKEWFGKYIFIDIARVFGCENSYNLLEYEDYRKELFNICVSLNLLNTNLNVSNLQTFCVAESLTKDIVLDYAGRIYRCWNNVFDENYAVNNIQNRLDRFGDPYDETSTTLDFVENLSLLKVNNGKCLSCKFVKYCQGLCPKIRKNIIENVEMPIYKNNVCKKIIKKRLYSLLSNLEV